jgi:hypothetical protein
LTPLGHELVKLYREIGEVTEIAAKSKVSRLEHLIREGKGRAQSKNNQAKSVSNADGPSRLPPSARGNIEESRGRRR